ncbi:cation:proton antiporter domain-containing protein, partial [Hymenobacter agri]
HSLTVLTWGGLRGGLSVALALSLPAAMPRELLVGMTYVIVVFSVIGQGLTIGPLVRRLGLAKPTESSTKTAA